MVKNDEIIAKIKEAAPKGKITCTEARKIASDFDVEPL